MPAGFSTTSTRPRPDSPSGSPGRLGGALRGGLFWGSGEPLRGGREQAESAGPVDGLQAAVGAELVVQVPHVRPDGVHRHVELAGDLRRGKAGLQEAQDAGLGLAERLEQVLWRAWRSSSSGTGCSRNGKSRRPELGEAKTDQRERAQFRAEPELRHVQIVGRPQLLHLLRDSPEIAALTGEAKPQDGQHDTEMLAPARGHRRFPRRGDREIPRALRQRSTHSPSPTPRPPLTRSCGSRSPSRPAPPAMRSRSSRCSPPLSRGSPSGRWSSPSAGSSFSRRRPWSEGRARA
jgi:hypothetical protein